MPGIDESRQFVPLKIAVLTVSDTRETADDKSGATLIERIRAAGHAVAERAIVKDEVKAIRQRVKAYLDFSDKFIDVVITTGGTGFTGRDVTPEAVEPLFEENGRLRDDVHAGQRKEDRHLGHPNSRHRGRGKCDLHFLPAGLAGAARTPGTKFWCTSSTTGIAPAISWRSCLGSTAPCWNRK